MTTVIMIVKFRSDSLITEVIETNQPTAEVRPHESLSPGGAYKVPGD